MMKFKALPILVGAAALGLAGFFASPANAAPFISTSATSTLNVLNNGATGNFGTVTITTEDPATTLGCNSAETG
jgi:hypothetical protein